ncbi:MAG: pantoate--beta-alanine ligase [Acidobacteria bacterium]|nr:pantoate--beta-alanine ligase [Acidobacteriota bacterium]
MHVSKTVSEWLERRKALQGKSIGFVPTMGALHRGHASLVERSCAENAVTVVSIFVNPLQFNDPNDLKRYPRPIETDLAMLGDLGTDEVLLPGPEELYPNGYPFLVTADALTSLMEGRHRPGHFNGVMTVVLKLLNLARADRAYFGEKDYQQLRIIAGMAADLFVPTAIVPCATIRAENGLALSSRNALLSDAGRAKAATIHRVLTQCATAADAQAALEGEGLIVDYVEEHWGRRFAAAFLEGVRLIDNVAVP